MSGSAGAPAERSKNGACGPLIIKLVGQQKGLRYARTACYLGVTLGTGFDVVQHVELVATRRGALFLRLAAVMRAGWGVKFGVLRILYRAVYLPTVLYAAGAWEDRLRKDGRKKLLSLSRLALVRMVCAYRTVSTDALSVCAYAHST